MTHIFFQTNAPIWLAGQVGPAQVFFRLRRLGLGVAALGSGYRDDFFGTVLDVERTERYHMLNEIPSER